MIGLPLLRTTLVKVWHVKTPCDYAKLITVTPKVDPNARDGRQGVRWMRFYPRSRQHKEWANTRKHQGDTKTGSGVINSRVTENSADESTMTKQKTDLNAN